MTVFQILLSIATVWVCYVAVRECIKMIREINN
nr:MAG TPA: hypothetical protein [Crassvirales sp.]